MTWEFVGKLAVLGAAAYVIVPFVMLMTMDSGWWWPWFVGAAGLGGIALWLWS